VAGGRSHGHGRRRPASDRRRRGCRRRCRARCRSGARGRLAPRATTHGDVGRRVPGGRVVSDARIIDQGYRPYEGPRRGRAGAVRSLAWHSVLRALGLRRTPWAKILPFASVVIAYLPAAVFVGVAVLVPKRVRDQANVLPTYHGYYGFITAAIVLFVALVGPEVLCSDRRNGMLGLYLASPLDRGSYLFAKVLAVLPVLGLVTLGPPLVPLVGLTIANAGPEGFG